MRPYVLISIVYIALIGSLFFATGCEEHSTEGGSARGFALRGAVFEATDSVTPISGVEVVFLSSGDRGTDRDTTGTDGRYDVFAYLYEGRHDNCVRASKAGYQSYTGSFYVRDGLDPSKTHFSNRDIYLHLNTEERSPAVRGDYPYFSLNAARLVTEETARSASSIIQLTILQ